MKNIIFTVFLFFLFTGCASNSSSSATKETEQVSSESIFNLTTKWHTKEGNEIELTALNGKVLCVVMIYTSCRVACPRLVADMKAIAAKVPETYRNDVQYVLVSIDPETDTPEKLKRFAIANKMDGAEWTFLQGNKNSVQEFANVLAVKYKEISPQDFSHSNIISVFDRKGELVFQQEGLGVDNSEIVSKLIATSKKN